MRGQESHPAQCGRCDWPSHSDELRGNAMRQPALIHRWPTGAGAMALVLSLGCSSPLASLMSAKNRAERSGSAKAPAAKSEVEQLAAGTLAVGTQMTANLSADLVSAGLTADQAQIIVLSATNEVNAGTVAIKTAQALNLAAPTLLAPVEYAAPAVVKGAVKVLMNPGLKLADANLRAKIIKVIMGSSVKSLKGLTASLKGGGVAPLSASMVSAAVVSLPAAGLGDRNASLATASITGAVVANLAKAGIPASSVVAVTTVVVQTTVSGLGTIKVPTDAIAAAVGAAAQGAVSGLGTSGLAKADAVATVSVIASATISSLKSVSTDSTVMSSSVKSVSTGAVAGLKDAAITDATSVASAVKNVASSVVAAVVASGASTATVSASASAVVSGAVAGLAAADSSVLAVAASAAVSGTANGLAKVTTMSAADRTTAITTMVGDSVASLAALGSESAKSQVLGGLMTASIASIATVGVTDSTLQGATIQTMTMNATAGLATAGFASGSISSASQTLVGATMQGLNGLKIGSTAVLNSLMAPVLNGVAAGVKQLAQSGVVTSAAAAQVVTASAQTMTNTVATLDFAKTMTAAQIAQVQQTVATTAVTAAATASAAAGILPPKVSFSGSSCNLMVGLPAGGTTAKGPNNSGGPVTSCQVVPAMFSGVTVNSDCSLGGAPTAASAPVTFSITPMGPGGAGPTQTVTVGVVSDPSQVGASCGGGYGASNPGQFGNLSYGQDPGKPSYLVFAAGIAAPRIGLSYPVQLIACGLASGQAMPAGLTLGSDCSITGTPTTVGTTNLTMLPVASVGTLNSFQTTIQVVPAFGSVTASVTSAAVRTVTASWSPAGTAPAGAANFVLLEIPTSNGFSYPGPTLNPWSGNGGYSTITTWQTLTSAQSTTRIGSASGPILYQGFVIDGSNNIIAASAPAQTTILDAFQGLQDVYLAGSTGSVAGSGTRSLAASWQAFDSGAFGNNPQLANYTYSLLYAGSGNSPFTQASGSGTFSSPGGISSGLYHYVGVNTAHALGVRLADATTPASLAVSDSNTRTNGQALLSMPGYSHKIVGRGRYSDRDPLTANFVPVAVVQDNMGNLIAASDSGQVHVLCNDVNSAWAPVYCRGRQRGRFYTLVGADGVPNSTAQNIGAANSLPPFAAIGQITALAVDNYGNIFMYDKTAKQIKVQCNVPSTAGYGSPWCVSVPAGNVVAIVGFFGGATGFGTYNFGNSGVSMAVDGAGALLFADQANRYIYLACNTLNGGWCGGGGITVGTLKVIAGNGSPTPTFTGGPSAATSVSVGSPAGLALDWSGNFYYYDLATARIVAYCGGSTSPLPSTHVCNGVSGGNLVGLTGSGASANGVAGSTAQGISIGSGGTPGYGAIAVDGNTNVYFADSAYGLIRVVCQDPAGSPPGNYCNGKATGVRNLYNIVGTGSASASLSLPPLAAGTPLGVGPTMALSSQPSLGQISSLFVDYSGTVVFATAGTGVPTNANGAYVMAACFGSRNNVCGGYSSMSPFVNQALVAITGTMKPSNGLVPVNLTPYVDGSDAAQESLSARAGIGVDNTGNLLIADPDDGRAYIVCNTNQGFCASRTVGKRYVLASATPADLAPFAINFAIASGVFKGPVAVAGDPAGNVIVAGGPDGNLYALCLAAPSGANSLCTSGDVGRVKTYAGWSSGWSSSSNPLKSVAVDQYGNVAAGFQASPYATAHIECANALGVCQTGSRTFALGTVATLGSLAFDSNENLAHAEVGGKLGLSCLTTVSSTSGCGSVSANGSTYNNSYFATAGTVVTGVGVLGANYYLVAGSTYTTAGHYCSVATSAPCAATSSTYTADSYPSSFLVPAPSNSLLSAVTVGGVPGDINRVAVNGVGDLFIAESQSQSVRMVLGYAK